MYRVLPSVDDDLESLRQQLRRIRDAEQTRGEAASYLAVHRNTIGRWLQAYQAGGVEALLSENVGGRPPGQRLLSPAAFEALRAELQRPEGFGSYGEVQQWLQTQWGEALSYETVWYLVARRLKAKLKVPRPQHPQKKTTSPRRSRNACSESSTRS